VALRGWTEPFTVPVVISYAKRKGECFTYLKNGDRKMAHRQARIKIAAGAEYQSPELAGPVVKFGASFGISWRLRSVAMGLARSRRRNSNPKRQSRQSGTSASISCP
jgi:hypothetical protein